MVDVRHFRSGSTVLVHYNPLRLIVPVLFMMVFPGIFMQSMSQVRCGAERMEFYLPLLKNKSIAVVANQASTIGTHS